MLNSFIGVLMLLCVLCILTHTATSLLADENLCQNIESIHIEITF